MNINGIGSQFSAYQMNSMGGEFNGMKGMRAGMQGNEKTPEKMLETKDSDGDGALSIGETRMSDDMFAKIDTDGSGLLSLEEIKDSAQDRMNSMRSKGKGGMQGIRGGGKNIDDMFATKDSNGDGSLSIEETKLSEELFGKIDADGNGLIDQEEVESRTAERPQKPEGDHPQMNGSIESMSSDQFYGISAYQSIVETFMSNLFNDNYDATVTNAYLSGLVV